MAVRTISKQWINLFTISEPPKYLNWNSPNLCFDFFNDSVTNNLRRVRKECQIRI